MDYPKTLTPSDWDKKKGLIAKTHPTGIGDALKALEKLHKAVEWTRYVPDGWVRTSADAQAFDAVLAERVKEVAAKVLPLAAQADGVDTLARKWAVKLGKEKLIPKSATRAAQGVAAAASGYADTIRKFSQQMQLLARTARAKLPQAPSDKEGGDDGEAGDKLFDPQVLATALQRLVRDPKLGAEFGFTPQAKDQPPVLLVSFKIAGKKLLDRIKSEKNAGTGAYGTARVADKVLFLTVEKTASGIVKGARAAAAAAGVKFKSVQLVDPKGVKLESDDEEDEGAQRESEDEGKDELRQLKAALEKLSPRLDAAVKNAGAGQRAALLQSVRQVQDAVKREDIAQARRLLADLVKLVDAPPVPDAGPAKPAEPTAEDKARAAYAELKKSLADQIKAALLLSFHAARVKGLFEQAEAQAKTAGQEKAALQSLAALQQALQAIADQRAAYEKAAPTVLAAMDGAIKSASPKNQERLTRARQAVQVLQQAGDFEKAQAVLVESGKLIVAIRKESTVPDSLSDEAAEGAGAFMQDMNQEADWNRLAARLAAVAKAIDALDKEGAPEVPSLRYELKFVREEAARRHFQDAQEKFAALETRALDLDKAYKNPDRKRWAQMDGDFLSVQSKLDSADMQLGALGLGKAALGLLSTDLDEIRALAEQNRHADACLKLATLKPKADQLENQISALGGHLVLMNKLAPQLAPARAILAGGEPKAAVNVFKAAHDAVKAAEKLDQADRLAGLRTALLRAAEKLVADYAASKPKADSPTSQQLAYRQYLNATQAPQAKLIKRATLYTAALRKMREDYDRLMQQAEQKATVALWTEALDLATQAVAKGQELLRVQREADRAARSFHTRYAKHARAIAGLKRSLKGALSAEQQAFVDAEAALRAEESKPSADYTACQKLLSTRLEPALKKLVDASRQATHAEVEAVGNPTDAGKLIDKKQDWELEILEPSDQTALLRKLRRDWKKLGVTAKQREQQRKVYLATKMDEDFLEHEAERREELVKAFKGDKEMKKAAKDWKGTDWNKRKALLQRVANQQCKAFGFDPVPTIRLVDLGGSKLAVTNGYFDPTTKTIVINTNPASSANDFKKAVDLILHENSHHYQDQLCTGMIDPDKRDARLETQVDLFKANDEGGGYVTGGEHFETYQKQPLEDHAHFAGPEGAAGIMAALGEEEDPDLDLSDVLKLG